MSTITQQQLESYLWGAAVLLRGTIDAGDYKQFIFPLLFFKRLCDVFDEETRLALAESGGDPDYARFPENHRFQIPPEAHWSAVRQVARDVGNALQSALRSIETANPDKLYGIFGDAQWTNKERLSDAMLRDLIEHFSSLELTIANLPEDELGQGYEYLIKQFADDSGHTAAEFYTNRTVVHLMTELLQPQPGESIYDPTCGSGGMLLSCIAHLRRQGKEWRNVRLYGQERNLMTSSIARMNCFLHGIEDFHIERGDTLAAPKFVEGDRLMRFDLALANPPYSIKQWDREAFASDPWGRNRFGAPPQGRADYAFWQHILASLAPQSGRCAILFPHGVLFRQEEAEMRRGLIEADLIECVIGLGPNLFYNSPMEACVVICRAAKPPERRGKVLLINAVNEVTRERAQSFLTEEHIARIAQAYAGFEDEDGFARVATLEEIRGRAGNLSIPLYVSANGGTTSVAGEGRAALAEALDAWLASRQQVAEALHAILPDLPMSADDMVVGALNDCALFDRQGWQRVRFGDVVDNVNETERDPAEAGIERYIGLEHLEPGSLHIRSWGNVADGTTFTRRCRPGQVLFGKRRAYQRKVAVAEFDAVVSGDIYVLAPKGERLLADLLPFICMSERFFQYAVDTSAGSLSPRTNWTHLAEFAFDLPPLAQQRRLAEVLWAVDEAIKDGVALAASVARMADSRRAAHFESTHTATRTIRDVGEWLSGGTPARGQTEFWGGTLPWVSPKDMKQLLIEDTQEHLTHEGWQQARIAPNGSILIVVRGMILAHSFPVALASRDVAFNQDMKAVIPSDSYCAHYLLHWFRWAAPRVLLKVSGSTHGTKRLTTEALFGFGIPDLSVKEQSALVSQLNEIEQCAHRIQQAVSALRSSRGGLLHASTSLASRPNPVASQSRISSPNRTKRLGPFADLGGVLSPAVISMLKAANLHPFSTANLLAPSMAPLLNRPYIMPDPLASFASRSMKAVLEQAAKLTEPLRLQHQEFLRLNQPMLDSVFRLSELYEANTRWQAMLAERTAAFNESMLANIHESWLDAMSASDEWMHLQAAVSLRMVDVASMLNVTEKLMARINASAIAKSLAFAKPEWRAVEHSLGQSMTSYRALSASIQTQQDLVVMPAHILPGATREVFLTGYAVGALDTTTEREQDQAVDELLGAAKEEVVECLPLLSALAPGLVNPYVGAHEALNGSGTDRQRHVLTSLRELSNHVLHLLSPDQEVFSWIPEGDTELVHDKRPTRRARVLYICRTVNSEPFSSFVDNDTRATVDMLDLLNHVHDLESTLTEEQLKALFYKVESWLLYVLRLPRDRA